MQLEQYKCAAHKRKECINLQKVPWEIFNPITSAVKLYSPVCEMQAVLLRLYM